MRDQRWRWLTPSLVIGCGLGVALGIWAGQDMPSRADPPTCDCDQMEAIRAALKHRSAGVASMPEQAAHTQNAATDALRERLDGIDANIGRLDAAVRGPR